LDFLLLHLGPTPGDGTAVLGTHFRTILGAGLSSTLVFFLVLTGGLLAFFLTGATIFFVTMDATTSISFFASFLFGSSSFFGFSSVTRRCGGTYLTLIMLHTSRRERNL